MEEGVGNEEDTTVRVAVRCRPFNSKEKTNGETSCVKIRSDQVVLVNPAGNNEEHSFAFDLVIDENATQESVWTNVGVPILNKAFNGYNGTIFAYGQTGSGKTWSMQGGEGSDLEGIIPRMNNQLFERIDSEMKMRPTVQFLITVSYFEIYNEVIFDLLDSSDRKKRSVAAKGGLEIKEHPVLGVYVKGLQELVVDSASKLQALIDQGMRNRTVASTQMNADSSRSHSVFIINIHQKDIEDETKNVFAKVNLVDLAGSERVKSTGATGSTLKEGANINKSLSALGNVINALVEASKGKGAFIPYRNSKLTRVLQESLGGNSVTAMLAALSPAACNFEETLSTLKYANRAKAIKVKAVKNEQSSQVSKLNEEIRLLKEKLLSQSSSSSANGQSSHESSDSVLDEKNRQRLKDLEDAMRSTWEAKSKMSEEYERDRQALLVEQQNAARQFEAARQRNWVLLEQKGDLEVTLGHVRSLVSDRLAQTPVAMLLAQWTEGLKEVAVLERKLLEQDTVVQVYRSTLERDSQALVQQQCGKNPEGVIVYDSTAFSMLRQLREKVSVTLKEMSTWTSLQSQLLTHIHAVINLMKSAGTSRAILNQTTAALHSSGPETTEETGLTKDERRELHRGLGLVRRQMQYKLQQSNHTVATSRRIFVNFDTLRLDFVKLLSVYDSATAEDAGLTVPDSSEADPIALDILQGLRTQAQAMRAKLENSASKLVQVFDRLEQSLLSAERELVHIPSAVHISPNTTPTMGEEGAASEDVPLEGVSIENFTAECIENVRSTASSSIRSGSSSVPAATIGIDSPQCWCSSTSPGSDSSLLLSFPSLQTLRCLQLQGGKCAVNRKLDATLSTSASAVSVTPTPPTQALSGADLLNTVTLPCGLSLSTLEPRQEVTSAALADVLDWTALIKNNPPEKFLKRPPVRFLFDLVKFIGMNNPGFLEEPLLSTDWTVVGVDKNSKLDFMEALIQFITRKIYASTPATTASAIVTGSEPELTNRMLQQLAIAVFAHQSQQEQHTGAVHAVASAPPPRVPKRAVQDTWVTLLRVETSEDGSVWEAVAELSTGLTEATATAFLPLPRAIQCRYLRLTPLHWSDEGKIGAALRLTLLGPELPSDDEGDVSASQLTAVMPLPAETLTDIVDTLLHTLSTLIEAVEFVARKEEGHKELKQLEVKKNMENLTRDKLALEALLANEKKSLESNNQDLAERLKACFHQLNETQDLLKKEQEINKEYEKQNKLIETEKTELFHNLEMKNEESVELRASILSYQASLEKEKSTTDSLQTKLLEIEALVETLQDQLQQGEEARIANENEKEEFLNQIAILTEERDGARAQEEELFEKLGEKTIDLDRLRESYVEITDRWNDAQDEAMDLRDKIDSMQAMLETRSFLHNNSTAVSMSHTSEPATASVPLTASLSAEASPKLLPRQDGHQSPRPAGSKGTKAVPPSTEQRTSKSSPRASRDARLTTSEDDGSQLVAEGKSAASLPSADRAPPRYDEVDQSSSHKPPPAPSIQPQQLMSNNNEYGDEYFEEYDEEFETED